MDSFEQGDQIRQKFAHWATSSIVMIVHYFEQKMGWATVWAVLKNIELRRSCKYELSQVV
jgi:hypothetical protein